MSQSVVGDIIRIEKGTYDDANSEYAYSLVGRTRGEVSVNANTEVAETNVHADRQMDKEATNEGWTVEFEHLVQSSLSALQVLGLIDADDKLKGFVNITGDESAPADGDETLRVIIYEDQDDVETDTPKVTYQTWDALVIFGSQGLTDEDYSTGDMTVHSRERLTVTGAA